jgi:hypothetical protein
MSYNYDRTKTATSPLSEKLHKGFTELQHAITTIDQVEFDKDTPPQVKPALKAILHELEGVARKLEKAEGDLRAHTK